MYAHDVQLNNVVFFIFNQKTKIDDKEKIFEQWSEQKISIT